LLDTGSELVVLVESVDAPADGVDESLLEHTCVVKAP
jgi:hypothetical protein